MSSGTPVRAMYVDANGVERSGALVETDARRVAAGLPVRLPPSYRGQKHYPGYFWAATMADHVVYESLLELSWLWTADFDQSVVAIAAQPLLLEGFDGGTKRTRFPDFLCLTADARVRVVDVKAPHALTKPEVIAALDWTRGVVEERGWAYEVWSGVDRIVLRNIQMIAAGRYSWVADEAVVQAVVDQARSGRTFEDLEAALADISVDTPPRLAVFAALWAGSVRCDMGVPLMASTWVEAA